MTLDYRLLQSKERPCDGPVMLFLMRVVMEVLACCNSSNVVAPEIASDNDGLWLRLVATEFYCTGDIPVKR